MKMERRDFCQNDLEPHNCKICRFKTYFSVSLKSHFDITHNNLNIDHNLQNLFQGFWCKNCDLTTFSILILARHICEKPIASTESNETNKPFPCGACSRSFSRKSDLASHIIHKHTSDEKIKWFHCNHCPYKAKTKSTLTMHTLRIHASDKTLINCDYCPFKTKTKADLNGHILNRHTSEDDIKWLECEHCSYKTKKRDTLKKHILRQHTLEEDVEWFKCEHCPFRSNGKWKLKNHVRNRHSWFECEHRPTPSLSAPTASEGTREVRPLVEVRYDCVNHWPSYDGKPSASRCKNPGCKRKSRIKCLKCEVHLCLTKRNNCFLQFHTQVNQ